MVKVAVAQMLSTDELDKNLDQAATLAHEAAEQGVKLLLLPENFALLDSKALVPLAKNEQKQGVLDGFLARLSSELKLWIIAGSLPASSPDPDKVYARCPVYNAEGQVVKHYDKVHLFDVDVEDGHHAYRESDYIDHGTELVTCQTPAGRVGLSICYDLRFPEHYQQLRLLGAEILTVPSAFTYVTGEAHWEVLLRARAIETQCFVLAANQGGRHSETRHSWGHSMVVDPWGQVLAACGSDGPGLAIAEIDLETLHRRRRAMPVQEHRHRAGF